MSEACKKALKIVSLEDNTRRKVSELSGGMQRRLNIACGIVHDPKLIIMDEPTVGVDAQSRDVIMESIKALNYEGASVIYTSHYLLSLKCREFSTPLAHLPLEIHQFFYVLHNSV